MGSIVERVKGNLGHSLPLVWFTGPANQTDHITDLPDGSDVREPYAKTPSPFDRLKSNQGRSFGQMGPTSAPMS